MDIYPRLIERLPIAHPLISHLENRTQSIEAGNSGEAYVDNFLKQVTFPKNYSILKDLHISLKDDHYLQIDSLILTQKYIAILEIKNIKGTLYFQKNPEQLLRVIDGETTSFKCPEQQIKRHAKSLGILLEQQGISLPIKPFIVFAYSKTIVAQAPREIKAVMGCDIAMHIEELHALPDKISSAKLRALVKFLQEHNTPFIPRPLSTMYGLDIASVRKGLLCPKCLRIVDVIGGGCPVCGTKKKLMLQQGLEDWFYLCKDTITNRECMEFLGLKDKHAAYYLLKNSGLHFEGKNRGRHYFIPKPVPVLKR